MSQIHPLPLFFMRAVARGGDVSPLFFGAGSLPNSFLDF
jgi:hypothetical protein